MSDRPGSAGWHPDPDRAGFERYWSGEGWTTHQRTPILEAPRMAATWAWVAAVSPLSAVAIAVALPHAGDVQAYGPVVLGALAAAVDATRLNRARVTTSGEAAGTSWAVLLLPLYLVMRTRVVRSTPAIPVVWLVSTLVALTAVDVLTAATLGQSR